MRCVSCRKTDTFRPWEGPITLMGIEVMAHGLRCENCGEILFDADEVRRQERAVASGLVARGVRTGKEFKFVRKLAGLQAVDLAAMLDVRPETVSRWERDTIPVPRTAAFALGELYEHPRTARQRLEAFARAG